MNKIDTLFKKKKKDILSVYFTAGFPELEDTSIIIEELIFNGVDMIEIGIPFSDPLADGPTIQRSSKRALENGMNVKHLFSQLRQINAKQVQVPLVIMSYLNPILQYGIENFCKEASALGISGLIIPDLPVAEYEQDYKLLFRNHNIKNVFLISPQTSEQRIQMIDELSDGFIYMVSSASTTGAKGGIEAEQELYFKRIASMKLKNPTLIGFGIADNESFARVCRYSNGAIIGSAFVNALDGKGELKHRISDFVDGILKMEDVK